MAQHRALPAVSGRSCLARLLGPICILFALTVLLAACQQLGPSALEQGRGRYNEKIHSTSREQLFANIIRVANGESPLFMDVTEVNATESFQNTLTGGVSGIGTLLGLQGVGPSAPTSATAGSLLTRVVPNQAGSVSGGLLYSETPTIAYQPLSGQPLIQQISTPIAISSVANLINSDWPHLPVLDFAFDRIAPSDGDYWMAIDAIVDLLDDGVLMVAAEKSQAMPPAESKREIASGMNITVQTSSPAEKTPDTLVLYLRPEHPPYLIEQINGSGIEENKCVAGELQSPVVYPKSVTASTKDFAASFNFLERNILHEWIKLLRIYLETQGGDFLAKLATVPQPGPGAKARSPASNTNGPAKIDALLAAIDDKVASMSMKELEGYLSTLPRRLELRTSAVPPASQPAPRQANKSHDMAQPPPNAAPVITTHSALGILLEAPGSTIEFLTPSEFDWIYHRSEKADPNVGADENFYVMELRNENSLCQPRTNPYCFGFDPGVSPPTSTNKEVSSSLATDRCIDAYVKKNRGLGADNFSPKEDVKDYATLALETRLGHMRRYLLIEVADAAPPDAFASFVYNGTTFYIDGRDLISRKNFALLNQFMTMMAVPSQSAPLTPTVNVGGSR